MQLPERMTIQSHTITVVPRYAETDKGGVIHHSVYPVWFEMGRTELLRANGVAYRDLEAQGTFFVVAELRIKYRRPAFYDKELLLETTCSNVTPGKVEQCTSSPARAPACSGGRLQRAGLRHPRRQGPPGPRLHVPARRLVRREGSLSPHCPGWHGQASADHVFLRDAVEHGQTSPAVPPVISGLAPG